jgi:hypothetical protein
LTKKFNLQKRKGKKSPKLKVKTSPKTKTVKPLGTPLLAADTHFILFSYSKINFSSNQSHIDELKIHQCFMRICGFL